MRHVDQGFDHATAGQAFAGPGMDTRQWVSYGQVDQDTQDSRCVVFDPDLGPLVNVTLQPSGIPVVCRVLAPFAGQGESEYFPFISGDEVVVAITQGDERAGNLIIGRCNQAKDTWPTVVAGQDATKNSFAFTRTRSPYVFETASSWMVRSAGTGAYIAMGVDGSITITDADKAFLSFNPDFIGFQDKTGALLLQLDLQDGNVAVQASTAKLTVDPTASTWLSLGSIALAGYGLTPLEHAASTEAVVNILANLLPAIGAAMATVFAGINTPTAGAPIAPAVAVPLAALFNAPTPLILAALSAAGAGTIAPYTAAIMAALALKPGSPTGNFPSVGAPGVLVG